MALRLDQRASLHVGQPCRLGLVHLQRSGHRPVALVGGGTGLIGDPSFRTAERPLLSAAQVAENVAAIHTQLERFLDFSGTRGALLRNNAEWLGSLGAIEFMREVGKHFTVNFMLERIGEGRTGHGIWTRISTCCAGLRFFGASA